MRHRLNSLPRHTLVFAILPVISLYLDNIENVPVYEVVGVLALSCLVTWILWSLLGRTLKDYKQAAAIMTTVLLCFHYYGAIRQILILILFNLHILTAKQASQAVNNYTFMVLLALAQLLIVIFIAHRVHKNTRKQANINRLYGLMAAALLIVITVWSGPNFAQRSSAVSHSMTTWKDKTELDLSRDQSVVNAFPNIYYIVLDGYARSDILYDLFGVDNTSFITSLRNRDFFIADKAYANYNQTALSLASSLNLTYLDDPLSEVFQVGKESKHRDPVYAMIGANTLVSHLDALGYRIVAFSTGVDFTELKDADDYITGPKVLTPFVNQVLGNTPLIVLLRDVPYNLHRQRIIQTLEQLSTAGSKEQPTFTFAHIVCPHPPFVFGEEGVPVRPMSDFAISDGSHYMQFGTQESYELGYAPQLRFVSGLVLDAVDRILAASEEPPIIIIQADHGPGSQLDWSSIENSNVRERMAILSAFYFPDGDYSGLYPSITPVNTFRTVLNQYLGGDLAPVEDRVYFSEWDYPYAFVDVTDAVSAP